MKSHNELDGTALCTKIFDIKFTNDAGQIITRPFEVTLEVKDL